MRREQAREKTPLSLGITETITYTYAMYIALTSQEIDVRWYA